MKYLKVIDMEDFRLIEFLKVPDKCELDFIAELETSLKERKPNFIIFVLKGIRWTYPKDVDKITLKEFSFHLRRILVELIYRDTIIISHLSEDTVNLELEFLLASDYSLSKSNVKLAFTKGYLPLFSGYTYAMFRGGFPFLVNLYNGIYFRDAVADGYLMGMTGFQGDDYRVVVNQLRDLNLPALKQMFRERFARDFHHYVSIEEVIMDRFSFEEGFI